MPPSALFTVDSFPFTTDLLEQKNNNYTLIKREIN